ncbi:aminotransferase class I/II-fold pyridoxal phosphate-dependent enzyme [Denitrobaculum tricleocarpae]|uniref:Aminotransferase class I/II-fold pyridoxal phosphate-dependent enzyme n=1 Tax=Denitrobaculum tricleocarpae TaxID=2591009 RepID=A0A545T7X6_9PROT|nr:aminotransferase class I/II-fold pyridoxal phosphate-dependent enzyme [Denitrobaculum tricleocarpae]TQV73317.1 aminotransferase class I/II-fold pyridoxal phosphate-dependent enzyme [Denitrobaculum tricleocarpae]
MRNFELETYFSKWEFTARHHMTASDVQSMSLNDLLAMAGTSAAESLDDLWLGYTETWGAPDLRAAIAGTYEGMQPDNILCFAGAEEGVYAAMRVLLGPDDHAIVVVPNYQAAETIPLSICAVTGVPLDATRDWRLDLEDVRRAIRPNTKLISINFPNNPTGAVMPREDYDALIALCREQDLYLFNDEVYRLLELDETKRLPQTADVYEKGLSLSVMSKAYGLPGLRIGWIASQDKEVLLKLERYKHYLSICNSAPSERLAVIALGVRDKILERNRALLRRNIAELDRFFADYPKLFEWRHPDGGCIAYPRYIGQGDVESFCHDLIEENGVLLLPASIYRSELMEAPTDRFRIGFGREKIEEGVTAFRDFLDRNHNRLAV